jgi:hypothetical protein
MLGACTSDKANTQVPPGDLTKFDPVASFAAMANYAGPKARLIELRAYYVKTDGTLDLSAEYFPRVTARFIAQASQADAEAQGPRAPGSGFRAGDDIFVEVEVQQPRTYHVNSGGSEWDEKHLGMGRTPSGAATQVPDLIDPPACSFGALWKDALAAGAPGEVVALITYDREGYSFQANGRDFSLRFSRDCKAQSDPSQSPFPR